MPDAVRLAAACLAMLSGTALVCLVAVRDLDRVPAARWYLGAPVLVAVASVLMLSGVLLVR